MKKNKLFISICLVLVLSVLISQPATAALAVSEDSVQTVASCTSCIMQGNTTDESDCNAFYNGLRANGYYSITPIGWTRYTNGTSSINTNRVTSTQFLNAKAYTVAYYSGHGSKSSGYPVLNASASNQSGNFSSFNVASLLGVSNSNWRTNSNWTTSDSLRVLVLASCHQLDSTIMKYYTRAMRASKIRAIAGYHATGPGHPTDVEIAEDFFSYAADGNSVWYSWQHANQDNGYQPWAVLVYNENYNMYYRLPAFPGNTYSDPSSSAAIYRYASHLGDGGFQEVTLSYVSPAGTSSANSNLLPLYIYTAENSTVDANINELGITNRETVETNNNILVNRSETDAIVQNVLSDESLAHVRLYQYPVVRSEIDPEYGYVEGSDVVVQQIYTYYNTYNGVPVNNAFIEVGVDADGVSFITNRWKDIYVSADPVFANTTDVINTEDAINVTPERTANVLQNVFDAGYTEFENADTELSYESIGDGVCKLHYVLRAGDSKLLVDAETGTVVQ